MSDRAGIFDNEPAMDLTTFTPQKPKEKPHAEKVREVAEGAHFKSREVEPKPKKREARRYRTGRDTQFNIKADREVIEAFYQIADQQNWVLGETFEQAVAALRKELGMKPGKN